MKRNIIMYLMACALMLCVPAYISWCVSVDQFNKSFQEYVEVLKAVERNECEVYAAEQAHYKKYKFHRHYDSKCHIDEECE